jgi:hypothetical protein
MQLMAPEWAQHVPRPRIAALAEPRQFVIVGQIVFRSGSAITPFALL